jgi:hypothetical protein
MKAFFDQWANFSSVTGLAVSLVGFIWTLVIVWKSKTASQKAERAALNMKDALLKSESLTNCTAAINLIEEIRVLHREEEWEKSRYRYSRLTPMLLSLKADSNSFSEKDMGTLAAIIKQVAACEKEVDRIMLDPAYKIKTNRLNDVLNTQMRTLYEILSNLKLQTKQEHYEG